MSTMWIRVKKDGFIYPFNEILAKNPECEVISEQEAFPEKFVTPEVRTAINRTRGRKAALNLSTEVPPPPVYTPEELAAEASRGMPS